MHLELIRHELTQQASLGIFPCNVKPVLAINSSDGPRNSLCLDELPPGSEPPPSPHRKRQQVVAEGQNEDSVQGPQSTNERYENACKLVGCQSKPEVLKLLRTIEDGVQSMPTSFSHGSYLGNRGGQALFLALAANTEDIGDDSGPLQKLRSLDLQGQGLGNEAAVALSSLLSRCPHLRSVNLCRNHISETGAQKLLEEIRRHPSLDMLSLDQNPVPSWLRVRLKEALATRTDDLSSKWKPGGQGSPLVSSSPHNRGSPRRAGR